MGMNRNRLPFGHSYFVATHNIVKLILAKNVDYRGRRLSGVKSPALPSLGHAMRCDFYCASEDREPLVYVCSIPPYPRMRTSSHLFIKSVYMHGWSIPPCLMLKVFRRHSRVHTVLILSDAPGCGLRWSREQLRPDIFRLPLILILPALACRL